MKIGFWNKRDHDFRTHVNLVSDLIGSLERIEKVRSSGMWEELLTFFFSVVAAAVAMS